MSTWIKRFDREWAERRYERLSTVWLRAVANDKLNWEEAEDLMSAARRYQGRYERAYDKWFWSRLECVPLDTEPKVGSFVRKTGLPQLGNAADSTPPRGWCKLPNGRLVRKRVIREMFLEGKLSKATAVSLLGWRAVDQAIRRAESPSTVHGYDGDRDADRDYSVCCCCGEYTTKRKSHWCPQCWDLAGKAAVGDENAIHLLRCLAGERAARVDAAIEATRATIASKGTESRYATLKTMGALLSKLAK